MASHKFVRIGVLAVNTGRHTATARGAAGYADVAPDASGLDTGRSLACAAITESSIGCIMAACDVLAACGEGCRACDGTRCVTCLGGALHALVIEHGS